MQKKTSSALFLFPFFLSMCNDSHGKPSLNSLLMTFIAINNPSYTS